MKRYSESALRPCEVFSWPRFATRQRYSGSRRGLRRLAVDTCARAGVDPATAAALLGQSPVVMLQMYRQVSEEDKRRAVAKARLGHFSEGNVVAFPRR